MIRRVLGSLVEDSLTLATTLEDLPYADNRVLPATDGAVDAPIRFAYTAPGPTNNSASRRCAG